MILCTDVSVDAFVGFLLVLCSNLVYKNTNLSAIDNCLTCNTLAMDR